MPKPKIWQVLLALWLVLWGLLAISNFQFTGSAVVLGFLAIVAAIFLLFDR